MTFPYRQRGKQVSEQKFVHTDDRLASVIKKFVDSRSCFVAVSQDAQDCRVEMSGVVTVDKYTGQAVLDVMRGAYPPKTTQADPVQEEGRDTYPDAIKALGIAIEEYKESLQKVNAAAERVQRVERGSGKS